MAARKGGDVLQDFEALAAAGAPVDQLRTVCVASLSTSGGRYRIGTPTVWPAGDLRRYVLTPA